MTARTNVHGLQIATELHRFIEEKVLPATGVASDVFWKGFDALVSEFAPKNVALLAERDRLQTEMDKWHKAHPGPIADMPAYRAFLESHRLPACLEPKDVKATTTNVDAELALQAGPQLVVPILNARYALNAANARWGSPLRRALRHRRDPRNRRRRKAARATTRRAARRSSPSPATLLDQAAPLANGSHADATGYKVEHGQLVVALQERQHRAARTPRSSSATRAMPPRRHRCCSSTTACTSKSRSTQHADRQDRCGGRQRRACSKPRSSTILDLEDSVAAVDAEDKVLAYTQLARPDEGHLTEEVAKGGKTFTRRLNPDREYTGADGKHGQAARPLADVHAQCRPPDDQSGHPVCAMARRSPKASWTR